jgi:hypothetical protein
LELLLTKLRYAAGGGEAVSAGSSPGEGLGSSALWNTGLQIVGMSATMPNVSDVATWLQVHHATPVVLILFYRVLESKTFYFELFFGSCRQKISKDQACRWLVRGGHSGEF